MDFMDLIPYIGMAVNAGQATIGDVAPTVTEWTASAGSTIASFAMARSILMLAVWDEIVDRTATKWDDYALKAARQVLSILAVKPAPKKRKPITG